MVTVRLARDARRGKKQPAKGKKPAAKKKSIEPTMSNAEIHLRRNLASKKKIKNPSDDIGLYNWLENIRKGDDDARSGWEKDLQERLGRELGLPAQ